MEVRDEFKKQFFFVFGNVANFRFVTDFLIFSDVLQTLETLEPLDTWSKNKNGSLL